MEVNVKKSYNLTYDPQLDHMKNKVKSLIKEQKFNEMLKKFGEKKISSLTTELPITGHNKCFDDGLTMPKLSQGTTFERTFPKLFAKSAC